MGNFDQYVKHILRTLRSGYTNCKVVARGKANSLAYEIVKEVKQTLPPSFTVHNFKCESLNKIGEVVEEFHFMISKRE